MNKIKIKINRKGNIMKKKIICLFLVLVFVVSLTSCFKDERNYDYKDMTKYITLPNYQGHVVEVSKDVIQNTVDSYIVQYSTDLYKALKGDNIYVNLKFTEVKYLDESQTIDQKGNVIESLTKTDYFIEKLGDGNYNKTLEDLIIEWGVQITKTTEKIITLPNDPMFGEHQGKKVYFSCQFVDKACLKGDVVKAKYVGYYLDDKGEIKLNDKGEKDSFDKSEGATFYLGSHLAIEDFENGIIGMRLGESNTKQIKATFPEDYSSEDLKGKTVIFEVTVLEIRIVPEYNDEFAKKLGQDTTEKLEAAILDNYAYTEMSNWLFENSVFIEFPKREYRDLRRSFEELDALYASTYGITFEDYVLMYYGMTKDEYIKDSMKPDLIYYAMAQARNIVPTDANLAAAKEALVEEYTQNYISQYSGITKEEAREMAIETVEHDLGTAVIYNEAIYELVDAHIKASYTVKLTDATFESVTVKK